MTRRVKKPPVKPEVRREWLRRHEEEGESPPQIAAKDKFDVRTVRKQIELCKQEREAREARSYVLRNALEGHYQDMCKYAQGLRSRVGEANSLIAEENRDMVSAATDPYLASALRQHLPRSPLWKALDKREQLQQRLVELQKELEGRLKDETKRDSTFGKLEAAGEIQAIEGIRTALAFQAEAWSQGSSGLTVEANLSVKSTKPGLVSMEYGFANMGEVQEKHAKEIEKIILEFESKIRTWEQLDRMGKIVADIKRVQSALLDELAIITHRRIVPGKCKYCPL